METKETNPEEAFVDNPMLDDSEITICLIKPLVVTNDGAREITSIIQRNKFVILEQRRLMLTREIVRELHHGQSMPEPYVKSMLGPSVLLVVSKKNAIESLRELSGHLDPDHARIGTLQYMFGINAIWNAVLVPKDRKEFNEMMKTLTVWWEVYSKALTQQEKEPLDLADKMFKKMYEYEQKVLQEKAIKADLAKAAAIDETTDPSIINRVAGKYKF